MSGWVKIYRDMTEWEWYQDANTFRVFMHLLLRANIATSKYRGVEVPAGSVVTGRKALATQLNMSEQSVRGSLNRLLLSELTIKKYNKFSIISIVKWDCYQGKQPATNQQLTSEQPANNQRTTTSKEYKNKEDSIYTDFETFWKTYPDSQARGGKQPASKKYEKLINSGVTHADVMAGLSRYLKFCQAGNFNKHAITWLNQEGWKEEWGVGTAKKGDDGLSYIERLRRDSIHI